MKESIVYRLQYQPESLEILLTSLNETDAHNRPLKDKWSIFENLAHLGRYQEIFISRIQQILQGQNPSFQRYVAEEDPGFESWRMKPFNQVIWDFNQIRSKINVKLKTIPDEKLDHTGIHPVYGTLNIEGWAEFFLLHEAHHFFAIFKLAALIRPQGQVPELNKSPE